VILPIGLPFLLLLGLLLAVFVLLVEIRILGYAYRKIGVRPRYVFIVMVLTLIGSQVNIPVCALPSSRVAPLRPARPGRPADPSETLHRRGTVVAINVGGALIPTLVSLYLFLRVGMRARMVVATTIVALVVNQMAEIVPGAGIALPMLIPPLVAAAVALLLAFRRAPPVAYVAGSMGALIGADIMNLPRVAELGAPMVANGGAGTFDGVFLTGIIAGLLV